MVRESIGSESDISVKFIIEKLSQGRSNEEDDQGLRTLFRSNSKKSVEDAGGEELNTEQK